MTLFCLTLRAASKNKGKRGRRRVQMPKCFWAVQRWGGGLHLLAIWQEGRRKRTIIILKCGEVCVVFWFRACGCGCTEQEVLNGQQRERRMISSNYSSPSPSLWQQSHLILARWHLLGGGCCSFPDINYCIYSGEGGGRDAYFFY